MKRCGGFRWLRSMVQVSSANAFSPFPTPEMLLAADDGVPTCARVSWLDRGRVWPSTCSEHPQMTGYCASLKAEINPSAFSFARISFSRVWHGISWSTFDFQVAESRISLDAWVPFLFFPLIFSSRAQGELKSCQCKSIFRALCEISVKFLSEKYFKKRLWCRPLIAFRELCNEKFYISNMESLKNIESLLIGNKMHTIIRLLNFSFILRNIILAKERYHIFLKCSLPGIIKLLCLI